jgi:hypothetical protein
VPQATNSVQREKEIFFLQTNLHNTVFFLLLLIWNSTCSNLSSLNRLRRRRGLSFPYPVTCHERLTDIFSAGDGDKLTLWSAAPEIPTTAAVSPFLNVALTFSLPLETQSQSIA